MACPCRTRYDAQRNLPQSTRVTVDDGGCKGPAVSEDDLACIATPCRANRPRMSSRPEEYQNNTTIGEPSRISVSHTSLSEDRQHAVMHLSVAQLTTNSDTQSISQRSRACGKEPLKQSTSDASPRSFNRQADRRISTHACESYLLNRSKERISKSLGRMTRHP